MPSVSLDQLRDILSTMRHALENALEQSIKNTATAGTCLYGSLLVATAVKQWTKYIPIVRGGGPSEAPGLGYFDGTAWHGHYWVELLEGAAPIAVADITADQFGGPKVQLLSWADAQAVYRAGNQADVDQAVAEERELIGAGE